MQPANISIFCFMLFLNVQIFSAFPAYSDKWTNDDMDVLKVLLQRLEESILEPREVTPYQAEMPERMHFESISTKENSKQPQEKIDPSTEFLSARDLKAVHSDSSSNRYSGCFGRKMDRIGSMSSLGCKTASKRN